MFFFNYFYFTLQREEKHLNPCHVVALLRLLKDVFNTTALFLDELIQSYFKIFSVSAGVTLFL